MSLLCVKDLKVRFVTRRDALGRPARTLEALKGVSMELEEGECFGVVGESGSGKSTLANCLLGLVEPTYGSIEYRGNSLLECSHRSPLRREIQFVFQDPKSSLDPRMRAWDLITEALRIDGVDARQRRSRAEELMNLVGLPVEKSTAFAHAFSGGQRQRIAIARALALQPRVLILDEPTSALDISVQAKILNLLLELQQQFGLTYLLVSHDIGVVRHMCHRLAVMREGAVVESGHCNEVLLRPSAGYTKALLAAVPTIAPIPLTPPVA